MCEIVSYIKRCINSESGPTHKRRPKKLVLMNSDDINHVLKRDNLTCHLSGNVVQFSDIYLNVPKDGDFAPSMDRVDSTNRTYSIDNVKLSCYKANALKGNVDHVKYIDIVNRRAIKADSVEGKSLIKLQLNYLFNMNKEEQKQQEQIWKEQAEKNKKGALINMNTMINNYDMNSVEFLKFLHTSGMDNQQFGEYTAKLLDYMDNKPNDVVVKRNTPSNFVSAKMVYSEFKGKRNVRAIDIQNKFNVDNKRAHGIIGGLKQSKKVKKCGMGVFNFV